MTRPSWVALHGMGHSFTEESPVETPGSGLLQGALSTLFPKAHKYMRITPNL